MITKSQNHQGLIYGHTSSWHDGGVAVLLPNNSIFSLSSERVGDRVKHYWDSSLAYDYLKKALGNEANKVFGSQFDHFAKSSNELEKSNHHLYHAASTFYGSPFEDSAILIIDGQGYENKKVISTSIWKGENRKLAPIEFLFGNKGNFCNSSIGHFYTAVGALAGMKNLHEEGKTMGLSAYGKCSKFLDFFKKFIIYNNDGICQIDPKLTLAILGNTLGPSIFGWKPQPSSIQSIWTELIKLRNQPIRNPEDNVNQVDMDIAYAGQVILEEILISLTKRAKTLTKSKYICLAGGVALNAIVNAKILKSNLFENVFIFPAPGDDGQAIGKLFYNIHRLELDVETQIKDAYFGPIYSRNRVRQAINKYKDSIQIISSNMEKTIETAVDLLIEGKVVGWFQGRSELGPRALGNRSILADARKPHIRDYINHHIKLREWYRPFAPIILEEFVGDFFDFDRPSPFMLFITDVKEKKIPLVPSVTHVDGTARLQTVNPKQNEKIYKLLDIFYKKTGVPLLLNTSFNRRNEPIVESPDDAMRTFLSINLDALVIDDFLLVKSK